MTAVRAGRHAGPTPEKAAEAAECAGEQDKYFEMHDKLFEDGVSGGVTSFKGYADDIGLIHQDDRRAIESFDLQCIYLSV